MDPWAKFYEAITKPLPIGSSLFLFVATSFLLLASDPILAKLDLSHMVTEYRLFVGLGFIIAATWIAVTVLIWTSKQCDQAWSAHQARKSSNKDSTFSRLPNGRFCLDTSRVKFAPKYFTLRPIWEQHKELAEAGMLYKPDVMHEEPAAVCASRKSRSV